MATTLTSNLRLRLDSNLTANARYNLLRIDALGAVFNLDNTDNVVIRSAEGIIFRPNDTTSGGTGTGGTIQFGSPGQPVSSVSFNADAVDIGGPLSLADQGTAGTKKLLLEYDSTLSGAVDLLADRTLRFDLNGADRSVILGGDLSLTGGSLSLVASAPVAWTLPAADALGFLGNDGTGTLSWQTAGTGTVTSVALFAPTPFSVIGSPITSAGTISLGFQNQLANTVLAGPTSGGAASPAFRSLAAVDLQTIPGFRAMSQAWTSGVSLTITHNWGTRKILVEVLDGDDSYREVFVDDETRPTDNTVVLVANEAPTNWLVLLKEVP